MRMQSKVKGTCMIVLYAHAKQGEGNLHDCLVCAAWLGNELATLGEDDIRYSACEILLRGIACHLHPGYELEERVLAFHYYPVIVGFFA
jgi:hypothetical protein